jgi:uncharacterized protein (TIGR03083 family)
VAPVRATADTYLAQFDGVLEWLAGLPVAAFERPSVLPGWDVRTLVAHLLMSRRGLVAQLGVPDPGPALTVAQYVERYAAAAAEISELTLATAGDLDPAALIAAIRDAPDLLEPLAALAPATVVRAARGPLTVAGWLSTRLLDLVVHTDDRSRAGADAARRAGRRDPPAG